MAHNLVRTSAGYRVVGPSGDVGLVEPYRDRRRWVAAPNTLPYFQVGPYGTPGEAAQVLVKTLQGIKKNAAPEVPVDTVSLDIPATDPEEEALTVCQESLSGLGHRQRLKVLSQLLALEAR